MRIRVLLMTLLVCCGVPFLAAAAQEDAPEQAMLGDLNRDGSCDIRDVQAMICQALQVREHGHPRVAVLGEFAAREHA